MLTTMARFREFGTVFNGVADDFTAVLPRQRGFFQMATPKASKCR
jgi:hypothetical protein